MNHQRVTVPHVVKSSLQLRALSVPTAILISPYLPHGRWLNLIDRTFHVLRKPDVNLLRTLKLFGAAQEAGRGKAAHGQHTY
jgi:hypothetical protein